MEIWKTIDKKKILTAHLFHYTKIKRQSPLTLEIGEFDLIECAQWVNVVAITCDQKIILIKQYRQGTNNITIEIPGGAVDSGEDSLVAAQRELLEETGFTSNSWSKLGKLDANPAFMTNSCETFLALNAVKTNQQKLDQFEEIEVFMKDINEINQLIIDGVIRHSLIVAGISLYNLKRHFD